MFLFYLRDGSVLGTTSAPQVEYIQKEYRKEIVMATYCECLDTATELVNFVIE